MCKVLITEQYLQDIADAIRAKLESEDAYTPGGMAGAIMEIETGIIPIGTKQIAANGTHDVTQYASAAVQVPNTYDATDEGKVVSDGALVTQTGTTITQNGTYDTTENDEVTVNVSGGGYPEPTGSVSITENGTYDVKDVASAVVAVPTSEPVLQSKTAVRNGTVTPDAGYDGLSSVVVNVPSTGPIAPIIRCGMAKGTMTQTLDLSSVNAEKLIVVAMNGDTDNKTLGTHVETLSSALTGTTLDYHQYSATGDNRMNYRIDAYDLSAGVSDLEISLTDGWVDEHTAFAWALIGAGDFVIGKVMTTLEAATTGSNDRSGSVLFGTMNGSGAGSSGGAAQSDIYHRDDTVATDDPGSGYMGSYIIWFAESGGGGASNIEVRQVGAFGGSAMNAASSLTVTINGYSGSYALISVCHRDTVATPAGCTLLDFTTYTSATFTNYTSVFKCAVDSAAKSITFTQASSARIGATVWVLDRDFTLTKTRTAEFGESGYYRSELSVESQALTYFTFSAPTAQNEGSASWAVSDGAWLCQAFPNAKQLRHFTGFIGPADQTRTSKIKQGTTQSPLAISDAQVCVYTVTEAA